MSLLLAQMPLTLLMFFQQHKYFFQNQEIGTCKNNRGHCFGQNLAADVLERPQRDGTDAGAQVTAVSKPHRPSHSSWHPLQLR